MSKRRESSEIDDVPLTQLKRKLSTRKKQRKLTITSNSGETDDSSGSSIVDPTVSITH